MIDLRTISRSSIFGGLTLPLLKLLKSSMNIISVKSGDTIFDKGAESDGLYIVLSGRLKAIDDSEQHTKIIGEIGQGESIGELGLILDEQRSCKIMAVRDSELAFLSKKAFHKLIKRKPEIMIEMSQLIVKRYKTQLTNHKHTDPIHTIAILPFNETLDIKQFSSNLEKHLKQYNTTCSINNQTFQNNLSQQKSKLLQKKCNEQQIRQYLNNLEMEYDTIIYSANDLKGTWTERILRQGDVIVIVANANELQQHPQNIEQLRTLKQISGICRWDLVLIHDQNTTIPTNTEQWLDSNLFDRWFHFKKNNETGFAQLARWYTGNAIGLVLSGGGARGLAHIGAIKALNEQNIPIDMIGGVSMGAVISSEFAYGCNHEQMLEWNTKVCVDQNVMGDFTLPIFSIAKGQRLSNSITHYFKNHTIEDLWIPFFCLSCNLTKATEHIHKRGLLWKAVRSSVSIPGITSPVIDKGDLYVDGGVINNLPSDVMCNSGVGKVIAIDVATSEAVKALFEDTDSIKPSTFFKQKYIDNKQIKLPNIFSILLRSGTIGSQWANSRTKEYADHYIKMPLQDYGMLEWKKMDDIINIGYQHMLKQIKEQNIINPIDAK